MDQLMNKYTRGFGVSLIVVMLVNAVLTLVKESYAPIIKGMATISGHHWITHGIVVILLFFILGSLFSSGQSGETSWPSAKGITVGTIVSSIIGLILIVGFYLI